MGSTHSKRAYLRIGPSRACKGTDYARRLLGRALGTDVTKYKLPVMRFNDEDTRRIAELEKYPRYAVDPWKREISYFKKLQRKAELEALSR